MPPPPRFLDNPKHWRERAEETRAIADSLTYDKVSQARLYKIAEEYERLAEHAEKRLAGRNPKQ